MPEIIFAAPGLGKSYLVREYATTFIDCDSVIEHATKRKVSELSWTYDWQHAKSMILTWWAEYFPNHTLITGKDRFIEHASVVYLHITPEEMRKRIACLDRENPITNWNCEIKDAQYALSALRYGKPIHRIKYLSNVLIKTQP